MAKRLMNTTLITEEKRAIKLFLFLFFFIAWTYDFFNYYILPKFVYASDYIGLPQNSMGYWIYAIEIILLITAIIYLKKNRPAPIKYILFITYTLMNLVNELMIYSGLLEFGDANIGGNVAELILILFSPMFVNKRFFFLVSLGTIGKYLILLILLRFFELIIPIALVVLLSILAFILLNRFHGYVRAVESSYDLQLEGIVKGVVSTLELKDTYTRGHSERVAGYSLLLAQKIGGFSKEALRDFNYACLLHDVGKVNIPDAILMKPGRLSDEEYEVIKLHPIIGAEAIQGIEGLENCIEVVRHHHERWDGKGYPDQLQGALIPKLARITAIADAFDAMTSSRSYRPAMDNREAYKRIIEGSGTQFDPEMVHIFIQVYPEWIAYQEKSSKRMDDALREAAASSEGR